MQVAHNKLWQHWLNCFNWLHRLSLEHWIRGEHPEHWQRGQRAEYWVGFDTKAHNLVHHRPQRGHTSSAVHQCAKKAGMHESGSDLPAPVPECALASV